MIESPDPPIPDRIEPITELPTAERPSLYGRRIVTARYEILSQLGKGGMGEVWHAYDLKLRVDVALKSLRMDIKKIDERVEALRREVRTAREVISPNVCRIFDLVVEDEQELISMEYIDGITLTAMLVKKGPLELRAARDIAAQFLAGLEAIHQAGLVHRDLKPENIMITRTGRVVVMDFGIARQVTQVGGTISGTLPYMSPEQLAGQKVDARSDVFSAGVVLAEMIHPEGVFSKKTREGIWNIVRQDPTRLPDGPWKAVISRAVAANPENRFPSAGALSRALEEVTLRVETIEERKPYPGLASFTAADAEYFFGRELEIETVIKKLQQLHLIALIGPSGAGKTSFLRAGLIPVLPKGWSHVLCQPGDSPLVNLAQALAPQFASDMEAIQKLVLFEDRDVAVWMLRRWRQNHSQTLLIIDRFEELFTLNAPEVQSRFAELVGHSVLEADIHVMLVLRDDFLMFCKEHAALAPIFSELTAMLPLSGAALRRALVQPALKCGYRFEDERLVDDILADVEKERGALPLMAFAAARLWEKRDHETGNLTREAYKEIGEVAGALAQHAESTMEHIGTERQPIVREIFRNLITAQNTRVPRDTDELLSVFPEKNAAEEVLRTLIDARLITSFEAPQGEGEKLRSRVEIIHESLLTNWPRLVRWQTQDVDSAQLRDQLRQAAQLWEQRSRSEDLLWTGTAFLEFQAWRQRYPGGLTATEEAFAQAMMSRATRRRRNQRILVSTIIVILLAISAMVTSLWRRAEVARQDAVSEARRAAAGKLLALGQGEVEADSSRALAYTLAATELADTPDARLFAMKALWKEPVYHAYELPIRPLNFADFSPDGKWLVVAGAAGIQLIKRDGSPPLILSDNSGDFPTWPSFSPDGEYVIRNDLNGVKLWSLSQKKVIRQFSFEGITSYKVGGGKLFFVTDTTGLVPTQDWKQTVVRSWGFNDQEPKVIGYWNREGTNGGAWDIDSKGKLLAYGKGPSIFTRSLDHFETSSEVLIGKHASDMTALKFHPDGNHIASGDSSGQICIWSVGQYSNKAPRIFSENKEVGGLFFDHSGSILAISTGGNVRLRNLSIPDEAESFALFHREMVVRHVAFHPTNPWLVVVERSKLLFYPASSRYPYKLQGEEGDFHSWDINFTSDGSSVITAFPGKPIQFWPVPGQGSHKRRDLWKTGGETRTAVDPLGRYILALSDGAYLISLKNGMAERLPVIVNGTIQLNLPHELNDVAFSADGKFAAAASSDGIEIWDVENKTVRILPLSKGKEFWSLKFSPDGSIFSGDVEGNLWQFDVRKNTGKVLAKGKGIVYVIAVPKSGSHVAFTISSAKYPGEWERATWELILYDLTEHKSRKIVSHGNRVFSVAFDPSGKTLVTGSMDGIVRVGPITDDPPHLLFGSERAVWDVAVDPAGKWIASAERGKAVVSLWSMPQGKPFHTLPHDEFLNRLRTLTNVRVVEDKNSSIGYRVEYAPFSGWEKVPTW